MIFRRDRGAERWVAPPLGHVERLDGLRGIAVLLVVALHLGPRVLSGGLLGVDVFFVLSGFLITSLILQEVGDGEGFGFRNFYMRRSLRLFPALAALIVATSIFLVIAWATDSAGVRNIDGSPWTYYGRYIAAAATYTTNIFVQPSWNGELLHHTWSLAVEEQYYLVWPVILVLGWRRRPPAVAAGLVALIVGCAVARVVGVTGIDRFLACRPEAIAAGSLLAILRTRADLVRALARFGVAVALVGLGAIAIIVAAEPWSPESFLDRGGYTLFALLVAVSIGALVVAPPMPIDAILVHPILEWFGRTSYGLYLWHFPLFFVWGRLYPGLAWPVMWALKLGSALIVTQLSATYIEAPARRLQARFRSPRPVAAPV